MEHYRSKISDQSFISGMAEVILVRFADDIKLGGKGSALERNLGRAEEGGEGLVQFSVEKNSAPRSRSLRQQCRLDMACLGSSSAEKASGLAATKSSIHHYSSTAQPGDGGK